MEGICKREDTKKINTTDPFLRHFFVTSRQIKKALKR